MTTDAKRIPVPESIPYHLYARKKTKSYQEKLVTILDGGKRRDDRKFEEARKICMYSKVNFDVNKVFIYIWNMIFSFEIKCYIKGQRVSLY